MSFPPVKSQGAPPKAVGPYHGAPQGFTQGNPVLPQSFVPQPIPPPPVTRLFRSTVRDPEQTLQYDRPHSYEAEPYFECPGCLRQNKGTKIDLTRILFQTRCIYCHSSWPASAILQWHQQVMPLIEDLPWGRHLDIRFRVFAQEKPGPLRGLDVSFGPAPSSGGAPEAAPKAPPPPLPEDEDEEISAEVVHKWLRTTGGPG